MTHLPISRRQALRISAAGIAVSTLPSFARAAAREKTLIVGIISEDPKKALPRVETMAAYLAGRLADRGIEAGAGVLAHDMAEMQDLLRRGEVDLVSETAFGAIHLANGGAAEILLREWKRGVSKYRSVFIAKADSGIRGLSDLAGKTIAFEEPSSTTGFLLPLATLRQQGLVAKEVAMGTRPDAATVGYSFAGEDINTAIMVARGAVDAGAMSDLDWNDFQETPEGQGGAVAIFHETPMILRSTILARGALPAAVKDSLKSVLLAMHEDEAGKEAMKAYAKVSQYDPIAGDAAESLAFAQQLYPTVAAEIR
jgi:phosphonate transport system substrate-binding protein